MPSVPSRGGVWAGEGERKCLRNQGPEEAEAAGASSYHTYTDAGSAALGGASSVLTETIQ